MSRLLGAGTLRSIVSGRYHRPRREERAFVFVDIRGSVSIEDRVGDVRFYSYVAEIFRAIEQAAMESGGDVLDYIGDQVMLSWPIGRPGENPFMFIPALAHHLGSIQVGLRSEYGTEAAVRVSIHAGTIVAGEIGEFHRKIMLLGSAVNVAARVEQIARDVGVDCIATSNALERFELPKFLTSRSLGIKQLRGKTQAIEVFQINIAVNRDAVTTHSPSTRG
jgi:adenylate cyclase